VFDIRRLDARMFELTLSRVRILCGNNNITHLSGGCAGWGRGRSFARL